MTAVEKYSATRFNLTFKTFILDNLFNQSELWLNWLWKKFKLEKVESFSFSLSDLLGLTQIVFDRLVPNIHFHKSKISFKNPVFVLGKTCVMQSFREQEPFKYLIFILKRELALNVLQKKRWLNVFLLGRMSKWSVKLSQAYQHFLPAVLYFWVAPKDFYLLHSAQQRS